MRAISKRFRSGWPASLLLAIAVTMLSGMSAFAAEDAEVRIVVFSDFQCPFCRQFAPSLREIEKNGVEGARTKVEFRNFPLTFHRNAQLAAQAAMAASKQDKFWEMHDLLFANQNELKRDDLLRYAKQLNLDMDRFGRDIDSDEILGIIDADKKAGEMLRVQGTPTFFINGKPHTGTTTLDELKRLVQIEAARDYAFTEITDEMLAKGNPEAPVKLEFFADLESPVTQPALRVVDELMARYPDAVKVQFRNFPLSFHPMAQPAHEAALNAARSGHFWDFALYVLSHQDTAGEQELIEYAGRLGMDPDQFAANLRTHRYAARIEADLAEGARRGIRGSPVIFVNRKRIDGVPSLESLTQFVQSELIANQTGH
jgi:protein-disulfide isomerase